MKKISTLVVALLAAGCMADIRPDELAAVEAPDSSLEARGRQLLQSAAEFQGAGAFRGYDSYQLVVTDTWKGLVGRAGNPWPQARAHVELSYRPNTFDGRARFLDGKKQGWTWGLQSWKTYQVSPEGELEFRKNKDAQFILPALQYLNEFVFRDHSDQVVAYAGKQEIDGVRYERVFVTWKNLEPTNEHDQYMAYIDAESGRLAKLHYTVREFAGFVQGTIHYEDVRDVAGVKVSFRQSITGKPTDSPDEFLHRVEVEEVRFGVPAIASFRADEGLALVGDRKVAQR